ncbi:uncharacterized protein LAJ45_04748 [Morchella importuna]|uniref:uncharacterized protein n=1 Tax=Morchella importuna TaxID=1174673 RepID=UPI001E8CDE25|nr:uncharacterized protein LAJ45_04748 [Morchella importuna]KAH8151047.1 hypothetical protein LAJ45_04748 [Morchella importuna]
MNTTRILRRGLTTAVARPRFARPATALPTLCTHSSRRAATTEAHERPATTATATKSSAKGKEVRLTAESYPHIARNPKFSTITADDIAHFQSICPVLSPSTGHTASDLDPFNTDWMRKYRGQTTLVLKPTSTHQVSQILTYCHARALAVVPQGGNTGLVGGSVPIFDEIVINLSALNKIRSFDAVSGVLTADAGVILEVADQYLAQQSHLFPLDLGAKGSCHIGGNVATNAGGLRLLRYGSLHGSVLGVEAVLPDGTVLDDLSTLRKNNTGYDLKQLFIGSEGTLGIITGVSILCPQRPAATNVAFFALDSYEAVQRAFTMAKTELSEILSAFEMMDGRSQELVAEVTGKRRPLEGEATPYYVLIETSGSNKEHDDAKLEAFLEHVMEEGVVSDGVLAQDETQARALWGWREGIPEVLGHWGGVYKYDVSIPLPQLYDLVRDVRARMVEEGLLSETDRAAAETPAEFPVIAVTGYGHIGDSNLHLNVAVRAYDKRVEKVLEPFVYEWIQKVRGSVSAEHGLGVAKREFVGYSRGETELKVMKSLKDLFDPKGIMNPYKYIKS